MTLRAYIGFGANLGDRTKTFQSVLEELDSSRGVEVKAVSPLYETEPQGISDGGSSFLNAAIGLDTSLSIQDLIDRLRAVELLLGKAPDHNSDMSRRVDLDMLLYGDAIIETPSLKVPHPRMHKRAFVLLPLMDIAPNVSHPVLGRTIEELVRELPPDQVDSVIRCIEAP
ncbi:MAG: 2-amino-4-hydroxy-6-hydroxymethyldihydropteridine diphosphokinase [Thermodesulfobacteriota bacterium]|nr:2-amino-4-hydroxy-6-hydroxymethyldihydropteridine diphosphokinase [Thermodesulfobacteriota bacterium]